MIPVLKGGKRREAPPPERVSVTVYRGIPREPPAVTGAAVGQRVSSHRHRWWSIRREIAAIWAGEGGTIVVGRGEVLPPKGEAGVVDLMRGGTVTVTAKEPAKKGKKP